MPVGVEPPPPDEVLLELLVGPSSRIRPIVSAVGWYNTSHPIPIRDLYEIRLERQAFRITCVDNERLRGGGSVVAIAVGAWRADEGGVPEQAVILYGKVAGGGDGNGIRECAREAVVHNRARETDVLEVFITKPSSGSNRHTDPV